MTQDSATPVTGTSSNSTAVPYDAPRLRELGTLADLTLGAAGEEPDGMFEDGSISGPT